MLYDTIKCATQDLTQTAMEVLMSTHHHHEKFETFAGHLYVYLKSYILRHIVYEVHTDMHRRFFPCHHVVCTVSYLSWLQRNRIEV